MIERRYNFDAREIIYSILAGLLIGLVGAYVIGFISAVAIPVEMLTLFSAEFTNLIISVTTQFLGFGLLAIIAGKILGGFSSHWVLTSVVCYVTLVAYLSVGIAIIYDMEVSTYFWGLAHWWLVPSYLVVPICLVISTFLNSNRAKWR